MKSDLLQNLIDWDTIMPMSRYSGGHDEQMQALFNGATVIAHWNEGDYQGTVATAVRLADGRFCWYQDSYGSCRGCDAWEDAKDEDVRALCIGLACDADVFDTLEEMLSDMGADDPRDWAKEAGRQLAIIIRGKMRCEDCGATEKVSFGPCPFKEEIHGNETPVWLCDNCSMERAFDI